MQKLIRAALHQGPTWLWIAIVSEGTGKRVRRSEIIIHFPPWGKAFFFVVHTQQMMLLYQ